MNNKLQKEIKIYTKEDFQGLRTAGKLAAQVLDYIAAYVVPGVQTIELNRLCHEYIVQHGAIPAPLGYKGYTKSICTSVNHVVCHGIPSEKTLKEGDILNIDVTVIVNGYYGDTSRMFAVGNKILPKARKLIEVTYNAMMLGIEAVHPEGNLCDIGRAIANYAHKQGCSVVRDFCGHGIGKSFHEEPAVLHYYDPTYNCILKPGMVFTVEPMINLGDFHTKVLPDGWTAVTKDKSLSAQFEHTIGVTETGYEIFTIS